jgi:hypothetical protein
MTTNPESSSVAVVEHGSAAELASLQLDSSESLEQIASALSKAQAEIKHAIKDAENPFHRSSYATLSSVTDACRGPLTRHGLSIVQAPTITPQGVECLDTILLHDSGEWIRSRLAIRPASRVKDVGWVDAPNDPQALGSTITYLRRYALAAMVGVAVEDDDGNAASGRAQQTSPAGSPTSKRKAPTRERAKTAPTHAPAPSTPGEGARSHPGGSLPAWIDERIGFGKYKEKTWHDLLDGSPQGGGEHWLNWMLDNADDDHIRTKVTTILKLRDARLEDE